MYKHSNTSTGMHSHARAIGAHALACGRHRDGAHTLVCKRPDRPRAHERTAEPPALIPSGLKNHPRIHPFLCLSVKRSPAGYASPSESLST